MSSSLARQGDLRHAVEPVRRDLHGLSRDERAARAAGGAERRAACVDDGSGWRRSYRFRIENAPEAYAAYRDKPVVLGIRPEAITDPEGADRNARNMQPLSNMVSVTEPAGSDTFVTMTLSGKDCIARMRADADVHPGQSFDFAVNMDKAVLFDPETEKRIA
jgi:ABC-type sugar transport system ATPase subunit